MPFLRLILIISFILYDSGPFCQAGASELNDEDFVFSWPDGRPLDPDVVTKAFHRTVRKAGLTNIRLHDLRHTHATLMLKAGVHPKVVSERLGHANIGITLDAYSHVLPGLQEAAAEKFDRIFEKVTNENSDPFVSKMLANGGGIECEPHRSRTCNLLIKRLKMLFAALFNK